MHPAVAVLLQGLVFLAKLMWNENAYNFLKFLNPAYFLSFPERSEAAVVCSSPPTNYKTWAQPTAGQKQHHGTKHHEPTLPIFLTECSQQTAWKQVTKSLAIRHKPNQRKKEAKYHFFLSSCCNFNFPWATDQLLWWLSPACLSHPRMLF